MNSYLHQRVRRTIIRHGLCPPGSRVAVGLSGGSDSVALVHLLVELAANHGFVVAGIAHLNHGLRPTADRDEQFCQRLADDLALRIVSERVPVQEHATVLKLSIEDAARKIRYEFLKKAATGLGADRVAVGHTRDDQAETVLMKLIRGAGLTGLGGIFPVRGLVIRPLIDTTRTELRAYLAGNGREWVEDETNEDVDNPRNRIRHRVLPELDLALRGDAREVIARTAALLREDGQWLDGLADSRVATLDVPVGDEWDLEASELGALPAPIRRRVVWRALKWVAGEREVGQEHVEGADMALTGRGGGLDVPGGRVELRGKKLVLLRQRGSSK